MILSSNYSIVAETSEDPETTQSCFANLHVDEEDRRLFDEAFIHESIGETEDLNETLFCEQVHSTNEELWDDLVEENVMEDLRNSCFQPDEEHKHGSAPGHQFYCGSLVSLRWDCYQIKSLV